MSERHAPGALTSLILPNMRIFSSFHHRNRNNTVLRHLAPTYGDLLGFREINSCFILPFLLKTVIIPDFPAPQPRIPKNQGITGEQGPLFASLSHLSTERTGTTLRLIMA